MFQEQKKNIAVIYNSIDFSFSKEIDKQEYKL